MVIGVLVGAFLWLLFSLNKVYAKPDFLWATFILTNWLPFLINIVCGMIILWFKEDIAEVFPITKLTSVMLGLSGQAVFKKIVNMFDRGLNKLKEND